MGIIKAFAGAVSSTLGDQWLDAIRCDNLDNDTLMVRKTTSTEQISKGSRIIVHPGQVALIVDNGSVRDGTAEPGAYEFDESTSPSFFGGQFGAVFKEMWERFQYNGLPAKGQAVYFFNTKDIMGNLFGTPAPVPYKDWGHPNFNPRTGSLYAMSVEIKAFGTFVFRIADPFLFLQKLAGTELVYRREQVVDQIRSEFVSVFRNTMAELGSDEYKIEAMDLPHKDDEIVKAMTEKGYDAHIRECGLEIVKVSVEGIQFTEESDKKIRDYELSDAYTQSGHLAGAAGRAMEGAANNRAGAMTGFMGMGMASNMAGGMQVNPAEAMRQQQSQMAEAQAKAQEVQRAKEAAAADSWTCACGQENQGKFCSECGAKAPASRAWTCPTCGQANQGKFCSECGTKAPADDAVCPACGTKIEGAIKFCPECGQKQ